MRALGEKTTPTVSMATRVIARTQIVSSEPWEGGEGAESEMLLISLKNAPISQIKTPGLPDNKHRWPPCEPEICKKGQRAITTGAQYVGQLKCW